jgi:hypothetical protein
VIAATFASGLSLWAVIIIGSVLAILALRRCRGPWKTKHILFALALLSIPLLLVLMTKGGSMDYQQRFDAPLTYQQASSEPDIQFPLPPYSRHINYAAYADWQVAGEFVRFEAPVEDCLRHVETVTAWLNRSYGRQMRWKQDEINDSSDPLEVHQETLLGQLTWFEVHRVRNGIHLKELSDSTPPQMWVDLDAGVFYFWWKK